MTDGTREMIAKKWVPHQATKIALSTSNLVVSSTSSANVGAIATSGTNGTRFCEVFNWDTAIPICVRMGTIASGGNTAATVGDRAVAPLTSRVFQVPQGGQGVANIIADSGTPNCGVNWGLARR